MRFWLGKLIGFVIGTFLGIGIILVPAVVYQVLDHDSNLAADVHALGPRMGFVYGLLSTAAFSLLVGLIFGIIGQAWGGRLQEAANEKNVNVKAAAMQAEQTENVWPPPPIKGDTDDAPGR